MVAGDLLGAGEGKQSNAAGEDYRVPPWRDRLLRRGPGRIIAFITRIPFRKFAGYLQSVIPFAIGFGHGGSPQTRINTR